MARTWQTNWNDAGLIGGGGQGTTHRVISKSDISELGVMKLLNDGKKHDKKARGRMFREVANLRGLSPLTPNVPRVLDDNTAEFEDAAAELFVVMELIPGPTLGKFAETNGPFDIDTAIRITLSLCKTIEIAHSAKPPIIHRDIKPENTIVRNDNPDDIVLVDFGLSFNAEDGTLTVLDETMRNEFIALPETNTPSGDHRDYRSDVTVVAAILYYCLTKQNVGQLQDGSGKMPHHRPGRGVNGAVKDDARVSEVDSILTRAFAPDIVNRFQSCAELRSRIESMRGMSKTVDETDPVQVAKSTSRRLREGNRITQVRIYGKKAGAFATHISKAVDQFPDGKLDMFRIKLIGGNSAKVPTPTGYDPVWTSSEVVWLENEHHGDIKICRDYAVVSQGEQCTLISRTYQRNVRTNKFSGDTTDTIATYTSDPAEIVELFQADFRSWVARSIIMLAQVIEAG